MKLLYKSKADDFILYTALLCEDRDKIIPILLYKWKKGPYDGISAELWFGVMSWIEKNSLWLSTDLEDEQNLINRRMETYKNEIEKIEKNI
ncbi:hypothetical protein ES703_40053 [subsurface metagenome]